MRQLKKGDMVQVIAQLGLYDAIFEIGGIYKVLDATWYDNAVTVDWNGEERVLYAGEYKPYNPEIKKIEIQYELKTTRIAVVEAESFEQAKEKFFNDVDILEDYEEDSSDLRIINIEELKNHGF